VLLTLILVGSPGTVASAQDGAPSADQPPPRQPVVPAAPGTGTIPDSRTQYPAFLANSYFGFDVGSIDYPFSSRQLEPGFQAQRVIVPHAAMRMVMGHRFHKYVAAELDYARPFEWVKYRHVNGGETHTVWVALGDVSIKSQIPVTRRVSVFGQAGLAIVSRAGFVVNGTAGVAPAHFAAPLVGGGVDYALTPAWDVTAGATYVPARQTYNQPGIALGSFGFRYHVRRLSPERVEEARESGFVVPEHLVQVGFVTNGFGYGWNNALSGKLPVFWGGHVEMARGLTLRYQRNVFHTARRLALDVGASAAFLKSNGSGENVLAISAYPLVRYSFLRTAPADVFVSYSIAGPSLLSRRVIDGFDTGSHFTFQDMLGFGVYTGKDRRVFIQVEISHYSNGNIFPGNPGVKVPLTITLGRGF
jgi:Lipid A 3-O-deacylase (PagL)/OmpA-like transmembrane domain